MNKENQILDLYHDVSIWKNDIKNIRSSMSEAIKNYAESRNLKVSTLNKAFRIFEAQQEGKSDLETITDIIVELEKGS